MYAVFSPVYLRHVSPGSDTIQEGQRRISEEREKEERMKFSAHVSVTSIPM